MALLQMTADDRSAFEAMARRDPGTHGVISRACHVAAKKNMGLFGGNIYRLLLCAFFPGALSPLAQCGCMPLLRNVWSLMASKSSPLAQSMQGWVVFQISFPGNIVRSKLEEASEACFMH